MRFKSFNSYHITKEKHQHFLSEQRNDPVTGDSFSEGDEVVFCSVCKSAFLKDSWVYMGNKHCDQRVTLPIFPKSKVFYLKKPIELSFVFVGIDNRSSATFVDVLVIVFICFIIALFTNKIHTPMNSYFYIIFSCILFTFRDSILINRSVGKAFQQMYLIDVKTNLPATFWQTLGRNLLYWVMNGIFAFVIIIIKELEDQIEDTANTAILFFFIGAAILITNGYYIKQNIENNYSWFDKLLGIRLVHCFKSYLLFVSLF